MPDVRAAMASRLATDHGLPIIFLREGDKRPKHKGEFEAQATLDPVVIQRELGNGSNANYGIAWGPRSGKFALDVDAGGDLTIAGLELQDGPLPLTPRILTQSGNYQDLFPWPDDGGPPIRNRGRFAPGLDVRGQGGQSVGPGSEYVDKVTGEVRAWTWAPGRAPWEIPFAPMPATWLARIRRHASTPQRPSPITVDRPQARNRLEAFATSVMDAKLRALATAPDGEQELKLGAAALKAGSLIARGWLDHGYAHTVIIQTLLNCEAYDPGDPWTYNVATYKVRRAIEVGMQSPEPDPPWVLEIEERERPREHLRGINGGKANGSFPPPEAYPDNPWREVDEPEPPRPILTPYVWRRPEDIPVRQWLYGHDLMRGALTVDIGAPGTGKTQLGLQEALSMASGKPLLGQACARLNVGVINGEDPQHEIDRRVAAAVKHFDLKPADLEGRLFLGSGQERQFALAYTGPRGSPEINEAVVKEVEGLIEEHKLDVLTFDPFVSFHRLQENDNMSVDLVAKRVAKIAERQNMAMRIAHHPRKTNGEPVTIDDSRGGGALAAAARIVRLLNQMTEAEAISAGLTPPERLSRFRIDHGKANLAPARVATWMRFVGVDLENGPEGLGDNVGVIVPWSWPNAFAGVTAQDTLRVQQAVKAGRWRKDWQSPVWVGHCVARTLGLDPPGAKTAERQRVMVMLKTWFDHGLLTTEDGPDDHGERRTWVVVGKWIDPT